MLIAISGPAGSGKTTLARILSGRLGIQLISTGQVFRQIAADRGLDVLQLNLAAEHDHSIDTELDAKIVRMAEGMKSCIVEARLACLMLRRSGMLPFCIYVDAPEDVRASRIAERDGMRKDDSLAAMRDRGQSEKRRYMDIYGLDPARLEAYDLVLDSEHSLPDELADRVVAELKKKGVD